MENRIEIPKRSTPKSKERHHRDKKYPDRIYRGRILKMAREKGRVNIKTLGLLIDSSFDKKLDQEWVEAMVKRLNRDKLIKVNKHSITL